MGADAVTLGASRTFSNWWQHLVRPFDLAPSPAVREELVFLQFARLRDHIPILSIALILTSVAAATALFGDLPYLMQFLPPVAIVTACIALAIQWHKRPMPVTVADAFLHLERAPRMAAIMGILAGIWCVNAFSETEQYYCVVAPVFVALSVLMAANCLAGVPNAAAAGVVGTITPIAIKMLLFPNLGIRCIAIMLIVIGMMQLRLIYGKFDETVRMIVLQQELRALASTDPLTGLANRRAFNESLDAALASSHRTVSIAMVDLDGFKPANDRFGHAAGDAILVDVAQRLTKLFPNATSIARLGGDEFAMLFAPGLAEVSAFDAAKAIRTMLSLPYTAEENSITISASVGIAVAPAGSPKDALTSMADAALYADKAARRTAREMRRTSIAA
jgi:diguanylate cyclase